MLYTFGNRDPANFPNINNYSKLGLILPNVTRYSCCLRLSLGLRIPSVIELTLASIN